MSAFPFVIQQELDRFVVPATCSAIDAGLQISALLNSLFWRAIWRRFFEICVLTFSANVIRQEAAQRQIIKHTTQLAFHNATAERVAARMRLQRQAQAAKDAALVSLVLLPCFC